jgi:hypothetical protein
MRTTVSISDELLGAAKRPAVRGQPHHLLLGPGSRRLRLLRGRCEEGNAADGHGPTSRYRPPGQTGSSTSLRLPGSDAQRGASVAGARSGNRVNSIDSATSASCRASAAPRQ